MIKHRLHKVSGLHFVFSAVDLNFKMGTVSLKKMKIVEIWQRMSQRKIVKEFDMLFKVTQKQLAVVGGGGVFGYGKMVYLGNETKEMRVDEVISIQP